MANSNIVVTFYLDCPFITLDASCSGTSCEVPTEISFTRVSDVPVTVNTLFKQFLT